MSLFLKISTDQGKSVLRLNNAMSCYAHALLMRKSYVSIHIVDDDNFKKESRQLGDSIALTA